MKSLSLKSEYHLLGEYIIKQFGARESHWNILLLAYIFIAVVLLSTKHHSHSMKLFKLTSHRMTRTRCTCYTGNFLSICAMGPARFPFQSISFSAMLGVSSSSWSYGLVVNVGVLRVINQTKCFVAVYGNCRYADRCVFNAAPVCAVDGGVSVHFVFNSRQSSVRPSAWHDRVFWRLWKFLADGRRYWRIGGERKEASFPWERLGTESGLLYEASALVCSSTRSHDFPYVIIFCVSKFSTDGIVQY